ncbi:hypothetical protein ACJX0J_040317, partial [Zea mays]
MEEIITWTKHIDYCFYGNILAQEFFKQSNRKAITMYLDKMLDQHTNLSGIFDNSLFEEYQALSLPDTFESAGVGVGSDPRFGCCHLSNIPKTTLEDWIFRVTLQILRQIFYKDLNTTEVGTNEIKFFGIP